jgi:uncharacterized protein
MASVANCGVAIMAKASAPSRTKTRLVPPLTADEAAALNTAFLKDIADNVSRAGEHGSIAGYVAFAPAGSEDFFDRTLPPSIGLIDAALPNFGDCLVHTLERLFSRGHRAAVVLNSDSPTLPTGILLETARLLAMPGDRGVLGPCRDGGYYLLGLKTLHRRLFDNIAWSTENVAAQTLQRAREINLSIDMLPVWYDVDDVEYLKQLYDDTRHGHQVGRYSLTKPNYPRATAALLDNLRLDYKLPRKEDTADPAVASM